MVYGGGITIAELKEKLNYSEVINWQKYVAEHGSLNIGRHVEEAAALIAFTVEKNLGGKLEYKAFKPNRLASYDDEESQETKLQTAAEMQMKREYGGK